MNDILQYLKTHNEGLDAELMQAVGISLGDVRKHIIDLAAKAR
jgi:predicted ArsR family transcriptional regulator